MINLAQISLDLKDKNKSLTKQSIAVTHDFYWKLKKDEESLKDVLTAWKEDFGFIYGDIKNNLSSNNKIKPEELAAYYQIEDESLDVLYLFFSIQTYFSVLVKLLTFHMLASIHGEAGVFQKSNLTLRSLTKLLEGKSYQEYGVTNFASIDWYCWILETKDKKLIKKIDQLKNEICSYDSIMELEEFTQIHNYDYIKQIYETVIPKQLRHALGEYYTPDWLADYTIEHIAEFAKQQKEEMRYLDPTCGSGTFLFKSIKQIQKKGEWKIPQITANVMGYDINPLAVLTAKANYLICLLSQMKDQKKLSIPVYRYDSLNVPEIQDDVILIDLNGTMEYAIPIAFMKETRFQKLYQQMLLAKARGNFYPLKKQYKKYGKHVLSQLRQFFDALGDNEFVVKERLAAIRDRINGFFEKKVDIIVGNPPWVNWEYLPEVYRQKSKHLWKDYGIFSASGRDLSFSKEDISVLVTYAVLERNLKEGGYLAFVIRQAMFKSAQNGIGFRKFIINKEDGNTSMKVLRVDDLSKIRPFENATNSSAILYLKRDEETTYPVPYYVWKKDSLERKGLNAYASLKEILSIMSIEEMVAMPVNESDPTSLWITAKLEALKAVKQVLGSNSYRARTGVFTGGANAVYQLNILKEQEDGMILVQNQVGKAKRKVKEITKTIEKALVYPLVQGSDLKKWKVSSKVNLLCPHTKVTKMKPIDHETMQEKYPLTLDYLEEFHNELDERKGFAGWEKEMQKEFFYAILRIGEYTFSKYKVAWRYIASEFITAVIDETDDEILGRKMYLPNEKIMYVSTDDEREAYYLCGVLSSTPIAFCVKSYMNPTSISAHVLDKLQIPDYDPDNKLHQEIATACKRGHETSDHKEIEQLQEVIDTKVAKLYQFSELEMTTMRDSLRTC
ncbi:hypothetical protein lbkm_0351 [Lachnospiraceae bacterium KM106-2]|nr:hypothetical protein lbkm_0351 [Lachnospiraceae bacterium KM106-2]